MYLISSQDLNLSTLFVNKQTNENELYVWIYVHNNVYTPTEYVKHTLQVLVIKCFDPHPANSGDVREITTTIETFSTISKVAVIRMYLNSTTEIESKDVIAKEQI